MAERASRAGARFSALAENIAEGPSAEVIHREWMNSPPHRANLLDPQLDSVGHRRAEGNGALFAVEDFSRSRETILGGAGRIVDAKLRKRGLRLLDYTERSPPFLPPGQRLCRKPHSFFRPSLRDARSAKLFPTCWNKRIQTGKYHSAAVGACPSDAKVGLSNYRIAVLLFE